MNGHLVIREVVHGSAEYWAIVGLRDLVLRQPLGLRFSAAELEAERSWRHFACYCDDVLAACLALCPLEHGVIRMRQVAVAPDMQRQGIGRALVEYAEVWARQAGYCHMVLHARETAVAFYEALGYLTVGARFEEVTISHWAMEKRLTD
ncbi:MAG: GNAT family N-acetyltransferase [Thermoguttaceae bacterium]